VKFWRCVYRLVTTVNSWAFHLKNNSLINADMDPQLKEEIESRIGHLKLYANSWNSWEYYRDRWEITREAIERWSHDDQTRFFFEGIHYFSTEELCIMFWQSLTNEEKDDFITKMNRDSEFGDEIEREYAHWEERNEMYLARREDEAF